MPVFHTEIKIVDLKGNECPAGEMGEILIQSPAVIKEYWKKPEDTVNSIVDGWLYSGDMGYVDDEGYLYIVDRRKDMYISGGENVYPAEVEDILMSLPRTLTGKILKKDMREMYLKT